MLLLQADDVIALWIETHKEHKNIIVSTDSDFYLADKHKCSLYNGVTTVIVTVNGFYDDDDNAVQIKRQELKMNLRMVKRFPEKCIRGDSSDNVFTAFPKARTTKIREAFNDRTNQGFVWNNFMMNKWTDHEWCRTNSKRLLRKKQAIN